MDRYNSKNLNHSIVLFIIAKRKDKLEYFFKITVQKFGKKNRTTAQYSHQRER